MKNDMATSDRREAADQAMNDSRDKNDEQTRERRLKADKTMEDNRARNDENTSDRRDAKDGNLNAVLAIFLFILIVLSVGALFVLT